MGIHLLLLLPLVLSLISILWLSPMAVSRRLRKSGFAGPAPMFPLGNIIEMWGGSPAGSSSITHNIHSLVFPYFARWRKTYGKVFVYWLGTEPFLYIAEPEFLKQVTMGALSKKWGKPDVLRRDRKPMFGNGLVLVDGDDWYHHRHVIAPAFSMTNLNGMINLMVESTSKMLDEWNKEVKMGNHQIIVDDDIILNAAEIIAKASFGISEENGKKVFHKLQTMQTLLFDSNRFVGVPFWKLLCPIKSYTAWKIGREIDQLLLTIIDSRKEQGSRNDDCKQDLLALLLAANEDDAQTERKLTTRELTDECKTFFFGGHETTALALNWTMVLLALYPEWQKALREEVMEVTKGGPFEFSMLDNLIKMGWVRNEVQRLYSPAPNALRQAKEDIHVGDIHIPEGTNMWIDIIGMHHDPALWGDDVNEFKPERFKEGLYGGCKHRMGYLPFGFGGRICIGRNLTVMEYKIVLSLILQKFTMSISPEYIHSPKVILSLRPSLGVPLILHPIEESS